MSWFTTEQEYDLYPEEPEVTVNVDFHYPDDSDSDSTPSSSDSGFDTPENYLSMICDDVLQNTR